MAVSRTDCGLAADQQRVRSRPPSLSGHSSAPHPGSACRLRQAPEGRSASLRDGPPAHPSPAGLLIGPYHQLWRIEKSFRMSEHGLRARPIYHHKRESIEAHLAVVFAALAVTHYSRGAPAGRSSSSSGPRAPTVPSRSEHKARFSPSKTPPPPAYETPSPRSADRELHTDLSKVGYDELSDLVLRGQVGDRAPSRRAAESFSGGIPG